MKGHVCDTTEPPHSLYDREAVSDGLHQSIYHLTLQVCLFALFCGMTHYNPDKTIFSGMEVTEPDWSELREEKVGKRVKQW